MCDLGGLETMIRKHKIEKSCAIVHDKNPGTTRTTSYVAQSYLFKLNFN